MKDKPSSGKQILIAGGGASGMCAAVLLARAGCRVTVIEKGKACGKKLSMTGNGRCNLSNLRLDEACYFSDDNDRVRNLLERFGAEETVSFFRSMGVPVRSEEGYLYPVSGEAKSVVNAFLFHMEKEGVSLRLNEQVKDLAKDGGVFLVRTNRETYTADAVLLSAGGLSGPKTTSSDGDGFYIAEKLGLTVAKPYPALCRLLSDDSSLPKETGVRVTAGLLFYADNEVFARECGEVQLTKDALSGIPVLQAGAACAQALDAGKQVRVVLDLYPYSTEEESDALIAERLHARGTESMWTFLNGFANSLINEMVLEREGINPDSAVSSYGEQTLKKVLKTYRALDVPVRAADSFRQAQATRGGVCLKELTDYLEAEKMPGLYITGELCNVDGRCGGYNLQWAWTSAMAAAEGIAGTPLITE